MPVWDCIDGVARATGLPVRKAPPTCHEKTWPGELVHIDIKKLGRIPDGGGWRTARKGTDQHRTSRKMANEPAPQKSYRYLLHGRR